MSILQILAAAVLVASTGAAAQPQTEALVSDLMGSWRLLSYEDTNASGAVVYLCLIQVFPPAIPKTRSQYPENTVNTSKPEPMLPTAQAQKLMTQGHVVGDEICTPRKDDGDNGENSGSLKGIRQKIPSNSLD